MGQASYYFALGGGMDLVTPEIRKEPGRVVASLNYEPAAAGYRRLRGFERYDGRHAPSAANGYHVIHFTEGGAYLSSVVAGTQLRNTNNLSWRVLALGPPVVTAGSPDTNDAVGYIGVTVLQSSPWPELQYFWRLTTGPVVGRHADIVENEPVPEAAGGAWRLAAIEVRRAAIQPVPGQGPVRGVWRHDQNIIAVRDSADFSGGKLYIDTTQGWQPVNFALTFAFTDGGPEEPELGDMVKNETTFVHGFIKTIALTSGSWAGGDAAGAMALQLSSGETLSAGDSLTLYRANWPTSPWPSFPDALVLADGGTTYQLPPGGRFEFITHNFFGASNLSRTYGVDGVGKAFEYDEQILTGIDTGMAVDTPNHIAAHANRLFLSFPGGSIQYSQVGEPTVFDPVLGAGEIGIGCDCTGFVNAPGALAIFGTNNVSLLYGHDDSDFVLETLNREAGALPHTAQKLGEIVYMDNRGLRSLGASQAYGNFAQGTLSRLVAPLLEDYRRDGVDPVASFVARSKDQYWCFFENGAGFVAHFGKKSPEILPFNLGRTIGCACSVEVDGVERIFLGGDDGYVYELDRGTSFDGAPIEHYLRLPFYNFGAPHQNKRLHKLSLELEAAGATTLSVSADLDYGAVKGLDAVQLGVTTGGGAIDDLGSNELYFASQIETVAEAWLGGLARNVSLKVSGLSSTEEPHTLTGVSFFVSPRGLRR